MRKRTNKEEWKQEFFVISELTKREIKRKYVRSYLGVIWSVLHPLLYMVVMSLIFSTMFRQSIENFPIYYLSGYLVWDLFSQTTTQVMTVLTDNRDLLLTVKVPKRVFVVSRCCTALVNFVLSMIPYLLLLLVFRIPVTPMILLMPLGVFFCVLFSLGIGYLLSVLYVFFADISYLYSVLLTLWMFGSAVFYPIESVSPGMQKLISINPVYCYIAFTRSTVQYGRMPDSTLWMQVILWAVLVYAVGLGIFKKCENHVMLHI